MTAGRSRSSATLIVISGMATAYKRRFLSAASGSTSNASVRLRHHAAPPTVARRPRPPNLRGRVRGDSWQAHGVTDGGMDGRIDGADGTDESQPATAPVVARLHRAALIED